MLCYSLSLFSMLSHFHFPSCRWLSSSITAASFYRWANWVMLDVSQYDKGRTLASSWSNHGPLSTDFKGRRTDFGASPTFSLTFWFLDQSPYFPMLFWLTGCLIFKDAWSVFSWKYSPYLICPSTTAEEPWPCWEPLHAKWDLIFPKYLGVEKQ